MRGGLVRADRPEPVRVGIGEMRVAAPPETLAVYGIGSCVVVFVHDRVARRGGLAHPLLPGEPPADLPPTARGKYAPSAIRALVDELRGNGRLRTDLLAKLVGGATMFQTGEPAGGGSIGERNVAAATAILATLGVPLVACEEGGSSGRSLVADPGTGTLEVWSLRTESRLL